MQRKCACGGISSMSGECEACSKKKRMGLQTKLKVNEPGDIYEQEADRIADHVMSISAHSTVSGPPLRIQRFTGQPTGQMDTAPASLDQALASPGRPMEPDLRQDMEQRFGHDFSRVRVHSDSVAEQSAEDVNAHAYTVGHNIVFGAGRFVPGTHLGRRLLAHELSHVVQQGGGGRKISEAPSSISAATSGYAQRQRQLPKFSQSTEEQIAKLMAEHPGLSRVNAERAIQGPPGSVATASGNPGEGVIGRVDLPKVPDVKLHQPTTRGRSEVFRREVKVFEGGSQSSFNDAVSNATNQLTTVEGGGLHGEVELRGGGEILMQVPKGTDARQFVQRFKSAGNRPERVGKYRSIRITIVDPSGIELLSEPWDFRPSNIKLSAGGGKGMAPVAPLAQGASGEIETGKPTGVTASGGGERLVPTTPPAQATHGEITVGKPPSGPKGGPPSSAPTGKAKPTESVTSAYIGAPLEPVIESTPGFMDIKGGMEGAVQVINSRLLSNIRWAEKAKAEEALERLSPEIEKLRLGGNGVTVTLVVEVPNQVDIAAIWAGIGDPSQVVYFKKMYISHVISAKQPSAASTQSTISANLAPGDPEQQDPHEFTLEQQIKLQMGEKYPVPGTEPPKGFHFASRELFLPSLTEGEKSGGHTREESSQLRNITGTYRPKFEALFTGHPSIAIRMAARRLQVEQDSGGKLLPKMWQGPSEPYSYERYVVHAPMVMNGRFALGKGLPPASDWIWSKMEYPRDGLILEWAKGMDSSLNIQWDALFSWHKI